MTPVILALVVVQAAFLLWASIRLSEVFMQQGKAAQLAWFAGTFALPLAIAWWGRTNDPHRILCGLGDCIALAVSVAFVRFWAVTREEEQFYLEREIARQAAVQRAETVRRTQDEEKVRSIAVALAANRAEPAAKPGAPVPPRPSSPSLLGGATRPVAPRKPAP